MPRPVVPIIIQFSIRNHPFLPKNTIVWAVTPWSLILSRNGLHPASRLDSRPSGKLWSATRLNGVTSQNTVRSLVTVVMTSCSWYSDRNHYEVGWFRCRLGIEIIFLITYWYLFISDLFNDAVSRLQWGHWIFLIDVILPAALWPTQDFQNLPGGKGWQECKAAKFTAISERIGGHAVA
jgi:hypothetical protein